MNKSRYDEIVRPFAYARQTPYLKIPEFNYKKNPDNKNLKYLIEEPREVLISSAYYKGEWWYKETIAKIKMMIRGESAGFIAFDYLIAIEHNIKTEKLIERERETMDEITFQQEYENIPFGENENSYFKLDMFKNIRVIKKAFYPLRKDEIVGLKKTNPHDIKRIDGEIRVISVDCSSRKSKNNDNTIITCIRLLPTNKGYIREFCYMESHQGEHTGKQALRIKQIYKDFKCDYIVLDLQNIGISIFEQLAVVTKDEERAVEYEAFTVYEHKSLDKKLIDELKEKTLAINAKPVIYPILAYAKLNSDIAIEFRDKLQKKMINILIDENEADAYLASKDKTYMEIESDFDSKVWYLHPYRQFSELVTESVNLEFSIVSGNIKIEAHGNARKDRYTACSYGNYFASLLEQELLKQKDDNDIDNFVKYAKKINNGVGHNMVSRIFR